MHAAVKWTIFNNGCVDVYIAFLHKAAIFLETDRMTNQYLFWNLNEINVKLISYVFFLNIFELISL